jgi:phage/plasmid-like protein (TIGR03299 family)
MAHEIDFSKGFAAVAAIGGAESMWHRLGNAILPTDTPEEIQIKAGADFEVKIAPIEFQRTIVGLDGKPVSSTEIAENRFVLYRSDTGAVMNTVTERYKPVQPTTIFQAFKQLCVKYGYQITSAGVLFKGGRYWCTADTKNVLELPGKDKMAQFVTFATSCDGSMSTEGFTGEMRPICNNTLQSARHSNVLSVKNRHSTVVDWDKIQIKLELVSDAWIQFSDNAKRMTKQKVSEEQVIKMLLNAYKGLDTDEKIAEHFAKENELNKKLSQRESKTVQLIQRLGGHLKNAPGCNLLSAQNTLWGAVNAVTYDIDHMGTGRTEEKKFESSQWGKGAEVKQRMWDAAVALAA